MINEKEIRKQLEAKQKELQEIQQQYDAMKYSRQIQALSERIVKSDALMKIIRADKLNSDDTILFADKIVIHLNAIYSKYRGEIMDNQAKRMKRNEAKRSRRSKHKEASPQVKKPVSTPKTVDVQNNQDVDIPAKPVVDAKVDVSPADSVRVARNEQDINKKTQNKTY